MAMMQWLQSIFTPRLRLENENEIQKQRLLDFQLEKQEDRASKQRLLESQTAIHKNDLNRAEHQLQIQKIEQEGIYIKSKVFYWTMLIVINSIAKFLEYI